MVVKPNMPKQLNILAIALGALLCSSSIAHAEPVNERQVKAAIFVNLARFIAWPEAPELSDARDFVICIPADDKMKPELLAFSKKSIHGRELRIRSLSKPSQIDSACRAFYVSRDHEWHLDLDVIARAGVLTVGDDEAFLKNGGGIMIFRHGAKLGFAINRSALNSAQLIPSSRILNLAAEIN